MSTIKDSRMRNPSRIVIMKAKASSRPSHYFPFFEPKHHYTQTQDIQNKAPFLKMPNLDINKVINS